MTSTINFASQADIVKPNSNPEQLRRCFVMPSNSFVKS